MNTSPNGKLPHTIYKTVVQHVGVGLICYTPNGQIERGNASAQRLLRKPQMRNVRDLSSLSTSLVDTLLNLRTGEKKLIKVEDGEDLLQLVIYATELRMRGETFIPRF